MNWLGWRAWGQLPNPGLSKPGSGIQEAFHRSWASQALLLAGVERAGQQFGGVNAGRGRQGRLVGIETGGVAEAAGEAPENQQFKGFQ